MATAIPTDFTEDELEAIDHLISQGVGASRSEVIRFAVAQLTSAKIAAAADNSEAIGQKIADSYRLTPQSEEELEMAMQNAIRLTEEEPW